MAPTTRIMVMLLVQTAYLASARIQFVHTGDGSRRATANVDQEPSPVDRGLALSLTGAHREQGNGTPPAGALDRSEYSPPSAGHPRRNRQMEPWKLPTAQLLPVTPPSGADTAARGDLPSITRAAKRLDVDLGPSRFVRRVSHRPSADTLPSTSSAGSDEDAPRARPVDGDGHHVHAGAWRAVLGRR